MSYLTIDQQIEELNNEVKCHLKPSSIHGIGVFALRDIKKGEKCYCFPDQFRKWYAVPYDRLKDLRPEVREVVLARWPGIINGSGFQSPNCDVWLISFMNHSDSPNYTVDIDTALRDIPKGAEVTEDYRTMRNAEKIYSFLKARSLYR